MSSMQVIHNAQENSIHPISPSVVLADETLQHIDRASSRITLSSHNFSLPITPRHRKPPVKAPETSVRGLPKVTGHSSCSHSYIEPLVRIDHAFRGNRRSTLEKSKKSRARNTLPPNWSKADNNINKCDIPLTLYLQHDRTSFVSAVTCEVSSI